MKEGYEEIDLVRAVKEQKWRWENSIKLFKITVVKWTKIAISKKTRDPFSLHKIKALCVFTVLLK